LNDSRDRRMFPKVPFQNSLNREGVCAAQHVTMPTYFAKHVVTFGAH
jgi:hypothetical protein